MAGTSQRSMIHRAVEDLQSSDARPQKGKGSAAGDTTLFRIDLRRLAPP